MVDVDNFKQFNDTYGHPAGDQLLNDVASLLSKVLRRDGDIIGRFGGDEYIAVTANISRELCSEMAEKMIQLNHSLHTAKPEEQMISLSIGVYWGTPKPNETVQMLVKKADDALYKAKHDGRNCFRLYSERS